MTQWVVILLFLLNMTVSAKSYSQETVTLNLKNVRIKTAIEELQHKNPQMKLLYNERNFKKEATVSVSAENKPYQAVLDDILAGTDLEYKVIDANFIAIVPKPSAIYYNITVTGVVKDDKNSPLPGVSILEKGTSNGTVTDAAGKFSITIKDTSSVLVLRMMGFQNKEVEVKNNRILAITLVPASSVLNEVVVIGYGTQKKSVVTGAIAKVSSEQLDLGHPTNVENALKGKVSGVQITSNSGQPGTDSKILIRGTGTINDSGPLYIIDGMPSNSGISYISPTDIESIEVLKDAASAAIYGARGANGVVIVTTKKGALNATTHVTYDFSYGLQNAAHKVDLLNSQDYQMLMNEMAANSGTQPYFPTPSSVNTNWYDVLAYKNAPVTNHRVTVNGGGKNNTFFMSYANLQQDGILAKGVSNYKRNTFRLNNSNIFLNTPERSWLNKITLSTIVYYTDENRKGNDFGNSESSGLIHSINMLPPTEKVYQDDPAIIKQYQTAFPNYLSSPDGKVYNIIDLNDVYNPLAYLQAHNQQVRNTKSFGANLGLDVNLLPGLKYRSTLGMDLSYNYNRSVTPQYYLNSTNFLTTSSVNNFKGDSNFWQWENVLSYSLHKSGHNLDLLAGTTLSSYNYTDLNGNAYDLLATDINKGYINIATGDPTTQRVSGTADQHKLASVFGRLQYNYQEKYLLEGVLRQDGSNHFGTEHKFAVFPSVSTGWVFTKESFLAKSASWLSFGKLRASWGQNGNESIGSYGYTSNMVLGYNAVVDGKIVSGAKPSGYANKDLKWETSEQTDVGLDLGFLNNSLTFTGEYFNKKTKDMLMDMNLPEYTGYYSLRTNYGTVSNKGFEFELTYRFNVSDFKINLNANASYIKNIVTNVGDSKLPLDQQGGGLGETVTWIQSGQPYGFFYGYVHDGIFQNQAEVNAYKNPATGELMQPNAKPGDIRFKDLNNDHQINEDDRTYLGKPNPDWTYGFNLSVGWKGFDISAFLQGVTGNQIYRFYRRGNITQANWDDAWLGRWHGEGTSNWMPRVVAGDPNNNTTKVSNLFIEDGSYLRMKVLQFGYLFPKGLSKKLLMNKLRIYAQADNLFTITKYKGYDPEVGTRNGFDGGTYPQARIFTLGASVTF
jgi:TonB-linked SusC/RagA family outer membrane protein